VTAERGVSSAEARCPSHGRRGGFALLAVLWIVVAMTTLALALELTARSAVATATNRLALTRARWRAEGCVEVARAAIADALGGRATWSASAPTWGTLDEAVGTAPTIRQAGCRVELRPTGVALDINLADADALGALFRSAGLPPLTSDSLTEAVLDWRDADSLPRARGAERAWYDSAHRLVPRYGPIADMRELHRVRGYTEALARVPALDTLLTTEPGRVLLDRAPLPVVATLPGLGSEALGRMVELRSRGVSVSDPMILLRQLSKEAQAQINPHSMELAGRIVGEPDAWILTARAASGAEPALEAAVELRLVHAGARAAIVRRRTWP